MEFVLQKFSAWEDRIQSILTKFTEGGSAVEVQREIDRFAEDTKKDIFEIRSRIDIVSNKVHIIQQNSTSAPKQFDDKISDKLKELQVKLDGRIEIHEKYIEKIMKGLNHLNTKQKEHEFKIENLVKTRANMLVNREGNKP
jgi:hypothetical protein